MSITVKEAMLLSQFKKMHLVAGEGGLGKAIDRIGILDFEIVEGIKGAFYKGDFVLTSFTAARNDMSLVTRCIKDLIDCQVSALAIKGIYYSKLPLEILELANKNKLPIFIFDEHVYFEYIIEDLMNGMHERSHMALLSSKIDILFKNELRTNVVKGLALEINRDFLDKHQVVYFKEKHYTNEENTLRLAERFQRSRSRSSHHSMIKYDEGLILILTYKQINDMDIDIDIKHILNQISLEESDYYIGLSNTKEFLYELDISVKESIYASRTSEIKSVPQISYKDIGISKCYCHMQTIFG